MKIRYDEKLDAMYILLSDRKPIESEEIKKNIIVDYDEKNNIIAIEILDFKNQENDLDLPIEVNFLAA